MINRDVDGSTTKAYLKYDWRNVILITVQRRKQSQLLALETEDGRTSSIGHLEHNLTQFAVNRQEFRSSALADFCKRFTEWQCKQCCQTKRNQVLRSLRLSSMSRMTFDWPVSMSQASFQGEQIQCNAGKESFQLSRLRSNWLILTFGIGCQPGEGCQNNRVFNQLPHQFAPVSI